MVLTVLWIPEYLTITETTWSTDQNTDVTGKSMVLRAKRPCLTLGSATYRLCLPKQVALTFKVCKVEIGRLPGTCVEAAGRIPW